MMRRPSSVSKERLFDVKVAYQSENVDRDLQGVCNDLL